MRELREKFRRLGTIDTPQDNSNVAYSIHGYITITSAQVPSAFQITGIYPFQSHVAPKFRNAQDKRSEQAEGEQKRIESPSPASRIASVRQQKADTDTMNQVQIIMGKPLGPYQTIQQLGILHKNSETINPIVMCIGPSETVSTMITSNKIRSNTFDADALSECVTMTNLLEKHRQKET